MRRFRSTGCGTEVMPCLDGTPAIVCGHMEAEHDDGVCYGCMLELGIRARHGFGDGGPELVYDEPLSYVHDGVLHAFDAHGNNLRTRSFARLLERAGLPPMRFHALRHAAATLLMAEGVPIKAISEMLGHSDVTTTLRVYAHVLPTSHDQAANAMDRLFGGS